LSRLNLAFSRADIFYDSATTVLKVLAKANKGTSGDSDAATHLMGLISRKDILNDDKITIDRLHNKYQTRIDEYVVQANEMKRQIRAYGLDKAAKQQEVSNRPGIDLIPLSAAQRYLGPEASV